ncbi:hypothetical protein JCM19238_3043 [Vibrio ponticus]|nr:hypothetical protein JCM19238_3043 [Vibrio ponticus]
MDLFHDKDQTGTIVPTLVNGAELSAVGLEVVIASGALEITTNSQALVSGDYYIQLQTSDLDTNGDVISQSHVILPIKVKTVSNNRLPEENAQVTAALQAQINAAWDFQVDAPIVNMTLDIRNLFTDPDGDDLKFGTRPRLTNSYLQRGINAQYSADYSTITLSGTPKSAATGGTMQIDVQDHFHGHGEWTTVELSLPDIIE